MIPRAPTCPIPPARNPAMPSGEAFSRRHPATARAGHPFESSDSDSFGLFSAWELTSRWTGSVAPGLWGALWQSRVPPVRVCAAGFLLQAGRGLLPTPPGEGVGSSGPRGPACTSRTIKGVPPDHAPGIIKAYTLVKNRETGLFYTSTGLNWCKTALG
jgi:hypothetical protein